MDDWAFQRRSCKGKQPWIRALDAAAASGPTAAEGGISRARFPCGRMDDWAFQRRSCKGKQPWIRALDAAAASGPTAAEGGAYRHLANRQPRPRGREGGSSRFVASGSTREI